MTLSPAQYAQRLEFVRREAERRRAATHCKRGHEFTPENTRRKPNGRRTCRICDNENRRASRAFHFGRMTIDKNDERHGTTTGYAYGCRCYRCAFAGSEDCRKRRAARAAAA